jgi:NarL family two-component system response regulator YdfI
VIRVLIADDHPVVREGLRSIMETAPDLTLVGEASDGVEAVRLASELSPDVVLMDLRMPGLGGIEAIEQIKARDPRVGIVILTTYDDDELIVRGLRAGARGYLLKDTSREVLFNAIRGVHGGELALPQSVADRVVAHLESPKVGPAEALSPRELEVLGLIAQGAGNKQIARRLKIAERTVKAYVTGVFNKLGVTTRAQAVAVALRRGLLANREPE